MSNRAATGLRPHEYLLRRRIEPAQQMLVATDTSVVEIALSVGFQTQSHFTTVFKRFTGQPPHAWRQSQGRSEPAAEPVPKDDNSSVRRALGQSSGAQADARLHAVRKAA